MHHQQITRRTLLHGAGAVVALPWLEAMAGEKVYGAAKIFGANRSSMTSAINAAPKRMAFLYVPNGMHMEDWTPSTEGRDYQLTPILQQFGGFRDRMNVLSGLTLNGARALGDGGGDHARSVAAFLTGAHPRKTDGANILNGVSVDQVAARKIGNLTRLPSLELGTEASAPAGKCDSGYSCVYTSNISWRTPTSPVAKEMDPSLVFDRLFSGKARPLSPEQQAARNKHRKSVLDYVMDDAKSLHRALGANDQRKLDEYLYAVREIETRLGRVDKLSHADLDTNDLDRPEGVPREYEDHVKLQLDMMVLAFQTDATRISTFMFANAGSNRSYREIEVPEGHHDLSHHGKNQKKQEGIAAINRHHAKMFNYFLTKMAAVKEGDGTLLDHSMIVYGSGIGDGDRHNHEDLPIVLVGSGGGAIQTGRHIRYEKETPLTNLYLSMLDRMDAGVDRLGDSTGRLAGLS